MKPLIVGSSVPPNGRMLLGRLAMGGALLATKDRERHPMPVTAKGTVSDLVAEQRQ